MAGSLPDRAGGADQPQWGQRHTRNMVSGEKGLPAHSDPTNGHNVKWVAALGTECYSTPVVAQGRVIIGTNNQRPRDPRHQGDRGALYCFAEKDGAFLWQLVVPKYSDDIYQDWPKVGIVSVATIEGDRIYVMSNRREIMCLDLHGLANGNDGPFTNEAALLAPRGAPPTPLGEKDADILWVFDMVEEAGIWPHDGAQTSILIHGRHLYINSGNGVDNTHRKIRRPDAPSLVVLDKETGRMVGRDNERIGPRIFHCTWSSPALGEVNGRQQIIFAGGDGVVYGFEPLPQELPPGPPATLKKIWWFDGDPDSPKEDVHRFIGNRQQSPSNIKSTPVFHAGRVFVTLGGDIWWGKKEAWIKCINAQLSGDISRTGLIWSTPLKDHSCTTPAIQDGLVFVADCGRQVLCLEERTGEVLWRHQVKGDVWSSPLVADGKVYVGSRRRDLTVFAAKRELEVLASVEMDSGMVASPMAANSVLYIATMQKLYALQEGARWPTAAAPSAP